MSYPLPSYAAQIWIAGDEINLVFPSPLDAPGHTVKFPASARGFELAVKILRSREQARGPDDLLLARKGAPSQYEVEAMYRAMRASDKVKTHEERKLVSKEEKAEAEAFLAEFGL